jgi:hypothetical protein
MARRWAKLVRRSATFSGVAIAAVALAGGLGAAAGATKTSTVHVSLHYNASSALWKGTFTGISPAGAVDDHGTALDVPRQMNHADWSITRALTDSHGTLRFRIRGPFHVPVAHLTWTILSGLGSYAGLQGQGRDVERVTASSATAAMSGVPLP